VLLDEDGVAAEAIEAKTMNAATLLKPAAYGAVAKSFAKGKRQNKTGRRPLQLGATVVMAPPNEVIYIDREDFAGDHADLDHVLLAVRSVAT